MNLKRITLTYVVTYLAFGGMGLVLAPNLFLKMFQSNQDYGEAMPRMVGVLMLALGGLIAMILYHRDYKYYVYSIIARTLIVLFLFYAYTLASDPFFLVINAIVLLGLIPSYVIAITERTKTSADSE